MKREREFDAKWRRWDLITCILSVLGFLTATVEYETTYVYNVNTVVTRNFNTTNTAWGVATTVLTVACIISIIIWHNLKWKSKKLNVRANEHANEIHHSLLKDWDTVKKFYVKKTFWFEVVITIVQPIPFYNYQFTTYFLGEAHNPNFEV